MTTLFLLSLMSVLTGGFATLAVEGERTARATFDGKQSYFVAESGVEDALYRVIQGDTVSSQEVMRIGDSFATTTITDISGGKSVTTVGDVEDFIRNVKAEITAGAAPISFTSALQGGEGGILMENSSSIEGDVYSNGDIIGKNSSEVDGSAVSAGPDGYVKGVEATGDVYANEIKNSFIEGDAYYQTISGTTVLGTSYPGSPDLATTSLAITDTQIEEWKTSAEAGGTITSPCPYELDSGVTTIGPIKINCDLKVKNSADLKLTGHVWVKGNITMENSADIIVDNSMGSDAVVIVADDPSNPESQGWIELKNSVDFIGNGQTGSYILLISQNTSAENGGSNTAIDISNKVDGDFLVFAGHGKVVLQNKIELTGVSAYETHLQNKAKIIYDSDLSNLTFSSSGTSSSGYSFSTWNEIE